MEVFSSHSLKSLKPLITEPNCCLPVLHRRGWVRTNRANCKFKIDTIHLAYIWERGVIKSSDIVELQLPFVQLPVGK